jgi:DNA modification methylase
MADSVTRTKRRATPAPTRARTKKPHAAASAPARTRTENWPADRVRRRSVASLVPYARNARTHSDAQVAQIAASIREWGWTIPVLIDEVGGLIAGHGRILAAQSLGLEDVPTMTARGWSDAKKRAYILADNKLTLNGTWNAELLASEIADLTAEDFDLGLIGFLPDELADLEARRTPSLTDPDEAPETRAESVSRPGDVWLCGSHRVLCGDCTVVADVARVMNGAQAVLMNTDPPYGIDYAAVKNGIPRSGFKDIQARGGDIVNDNLTDGPVLQAFLESAIRVAVPHLIDRAAFYFWNPMLTQGTFFAAADILIHRQIIWVKPHMVLTRSGMYHWRHELCFYGWRRGHTPAWLGSKGQTSVWDDLRADNVDREHPTQKPVELFERPILNHTKAGDSIYEPFCGSGSQVVAAEMSGRFCHAIEIEPRYVDVTVRRWENFAGQTATLESTGQTFAEIEAARSSAPAA